MNIYKGLLFLDGFRIAPEHADDAAAPAASMAAPQPARASAPTRVRPAMPRWRRTLRGVAAFAEVLPVEPPPRCCG